MKLIFIYKKFKIGLDFSTRRAYNSHHDVGYKYKGLASENSTISTSHRQNSDKGVDFVLSYIDK